MFPKVVFALLCLAGYASAFTLPAALQLRENTQCFSSKEGSGCSVTEDFGLYACSLNRYDIVSLIHSSLEHTHTHTCTVAKDRSVTDHLQPCWSVGPICALRRAHVPLRRDRDPVLLG